jgi:hypothetical protein
VIKGQMFPPGVYGPRVIVSLFALAGIGLLGVMFSQRFATYLLHVGPQQVRLRRSFIIPKVQTMATQDIESVWRVKAYSHSSGDGGDTVFDIQIGAGFKRLRFGGSLPSADQHWLAWELREYLRTHGATKIPEELRRR